MIGLPTLEGPVSPSSVPADHKVKIAARLGRAGGEKAGSDSKGVEMQAQALEPKWQYGSLSLLLSLSLSLSFPLVRPASYLSPPPIQTHESAL